MKFGKFSSAALVAAAFLCSVVAAAQTQPGSTGLDIPGNVQFVGTPQPGVRKATAIVNGEVITESDIDHRLAMLLASQQGVEIPPEELQRVRAQVLRNLIDETLQIQAAAQQEITIEQREVDQYYSQVARDRNQTPESLTAYMRSIGSSERSVKRQIRGEMAWRRVQQRQIQPFVTVGEDEVQAVIDQLNASRGTAQYRVAEIFISATPETMAEARTNAGRIVQQVRAGASFQGYARQFSEASTAAVGGDLGWVRAEQLPSELAGIVQQMPVGAISDPIEIPGGFSIVALGDKRQLGVADPRDAMLSLMQMSLVLPAGTNEATAQGRAQQMAQATQAMGGCGGATQAATTIGAELISNDQVRVRELPPQIQQVLLSLNVGQASPPFGSTERISVLVLCGRDDPPPAGAPNADQIAQTMEDERVGRRAQRYLRDLRRDAVVDYR